MRKKKKRRMSALTFSVCLLACYLSFSVSEEITAKSGGDVTLQCQSPRGANIILLKWSRPDLKKDEYVLFIRENRSYENYQHPSFRGRVQLRDPEMKNGDASVILKNVNVNDAGTYQCRVAVGNNKGPELMNSINLKVEDSAHTAGHTGGHKDGGDEDGGDKEAGKKEEQNLGLTVGLPVTALVLVLVAVGGFVIHRKRRQRPDQPVHYRAAVSQPV